MLSYGDSCTYIEYKDSLYFFLKLYEKVLVGNRIDHRMIDAVELAPILPITGSVIRTADYERASSLLLPPLKQTSKLLIHIPKRRSVAFQTVIQRPLQIKIVRIMNRVYIQIEENMLLRIRFGYLF